jgi:D-methionine transport system substrate-binding protein
MNKFVKVLSALLVASVALTGCGSKSQESSSTAEKSEANKTTKLVVGATPLPHAEILKIVQPVLKEKGIELEIKEFTDYVTPNTAVNDKQIDANFFQHVPYMEDFNKQNGTNLVAVGKVHVEPLAAYSSKIKTKDEIKDGAVIAIPNDATNEGRALLLLQKQGLIKLKDSTALTQTPKDIVENSKNLEFKELEAAQLPRVLPDVDIAIINTNYAIEAKLNPTGDSLFIEDQDSPYANVLSARPDNQNDPAIQELLKALNSPEVKKFIEEQYKGAVVPAF